MTCLATRDVQVRQDLEKLKECTHLGCAQEHRRGLPLATEGAAAALPGKLQSDVNEAVLMHGTSPDVLLSVRAVPGGAERAHANSRAMALRLCMRVDQSHAGAGTHACAHAHAQLLSRGFNERYSGTNAGAAYGEGIYLAEDAGKNDRYTEVDVDYKALDPSRPTDLAELHERLYMNNRKSRMFHPGEVYYLLVCRVALGHHVRTQGWNRDMDRGGSVFPPSTIRELAQVPHVTPPVHYHSLLVHVAPYREVVVFHSDRIYPEYVLAYQRVDRARAHRELVEACSGSSGV